ncbi:MULTISPECIES: UTP--glucose-1-phosphate uridylyltransferase GalU [Cellulosilyticum]|uniref:UTP--glucose-1-phosphate uridylyltransferase n=1 Tax=Cellulosilyticum lentocellum (strain ATCC 49066 / DSM 5427 / NCIMB 11756 / RHM5) TaxID=642492 RepID=F2JIN7_CELLD|nr:MULTISPECIES: UTP--glucose-1-phosphate uridylyltransferase GalU [Cellulosilyticum]ADZ85507.1 UTP-glucose-1-phosphate uridylyltransferase [Cellulosilyticum lentocellum DSM 5427]QEH66991.1 UTP--glucose-1-phosphate uridylyltransferase GalU [Cellulosilyticum sp. WCF-2]
MSKIRKAIIPAAGLGTRFLPATKAQPKEMLPIVDKPTIQYIVEEAVASGIEDIIIVTGRTKKAIEDHFDKSVELEMELEKKQSKKLLEIARSVSQIANIYYIRQKEPKGLGHAVLTAKTFVGNEPFAVLLGDDVIDSEKPALKQMIEVYEKYNASVLGVQTVERKDVNKYGIVDGVQLDSRIYEVKNMVEKPPIDEAPTNVAVLGRYIITPRIFDYLEKQEIGAGGEIQLTDALNKLAKEEPMYAYDFIGHRYDVGNKMGFLQATVEFALKRPELNEEFKAYLKEIVKTF